MVINDLVVKETQLEVFPILPLREVVVFPNIIATLYVGREKSLNALDFAVNNNSKIILVTQKDPVVEDLGEQDLYSIGVMGNILQIIKLADGNTKVLVESLERVKINKVIEGGSYLLASVDVLKIDENSIDALEYEAMLRALKESFEIFINSSKKLSNELLGVIKNFDDIAKLSDIIIYNLPINIIEKQAILEINNLKQKVEKVLVVLESENDVIAAENSIKTNVRKQIDKTQKEYYLNEQLKAIQKELGNETEEKNDIKELEEKIKNTKLSKEANEKLTQELKKLKQMHYMSAEASVVRNYIDFVLSLPWGKFSEVKTKLQEAEDVLNKDHFGIEKPKERIVEYLAVQQRSNEIKGPILCFVGPPGVGKTSLAKSIAEATGRQFAKIALGGVRDESEIRGHRRTYIGALPGRILSAMKKINSQNPVILLDEIDKLGMDFRGDPSSALLEVLDPEQNATFVDHYLDLEFDLSKVLFVATANSTDIPRALLDRMELIRISGYTEEEKIEIAMRHLLPKIKKEHAIKVDEIDISKEIVIEVIRHYTKEAGVRNLERELAKITRKSLKKIISENLEKFVVTKEELENLLGVPKYLQTEILKENLVGVTNGLAYTEAGGELLNIEAVLVPGKGNVKVTGKLGDVMQESAQTAISYVKSKTAELGINKEYYNDFDLHIHVPEGATPKDGPSAGIALCTTITSILTKIPVKHDIAMTGEITLTGRVLAIGGLKEKLLVALRSGIKQVIIPQENVKDLKELPSIIKDNLEILPVSTANEVLEYALTKKPFVQTDDDKKVVIPNNSDSKSKKEICDNPKTIN